MTRATLNCRLAPVALAVLAALPPAWGQAGAAVTAEPTEIPIHHQLRWLDEVEPFLAEGEREAYLALADAHSRTLFQREFWRARDPTTRTRLNETKEQYLHHLVTTRFDRLPPTDDRARARLLLGPPDSSHLHGDCGKAREARFASGCWMAPTFELLHYDRTADRQAVDVILSAGGGECRLLGPGERFRAHLLSTGNCIANQRHVESQIKTAQRERRSWDRLAELGLRAPPRPWLATLERKIRDEAALPAELRVVTTNPVRRSDRAAGVRLRRVASIFEIPLPDDWWRHPTPWRILYVRADVLLDDRLVDAYDARQSLMARPEHTLQLPLELHLSSARAHTVVVHVEDEAAELFETAAFRIEGLPEPGIRLASPAAPFAESLSAPAPAVAQMALPRFDIAPLRGLRIGPTGVRVDSTVPAVSRVDYLLEERTVASSAEPPFAVEIDLGKVPREQTLEAVGFDRSGTPVARDQWTLNPGASRFRIHLTDLSHLTSGVLHVRGRVEVPTGARLTGVELYEDDELVASGASTRFHYQREETRDERAGRNVTVLRAAAHLDDGRTASSTRLLTRNPLEEVEVDLVEVFASVRERNGPPVTDLRKDEVRVLEEGRPQQLRHFERIEDLPLNLLLLLDISGTMKEEMAMSRLSALTFIERMIREDDRAALVVFSGAAYVAAPFTNDLETLREGSRSLAAWGSTALWDSTVVTLYYLLGLEGKSALVLLSDGLDRSSQIDFGATLEFAERSGIAVYTIELSLPTLSRQRSSGGGRLRRLAQRTGGRHFRLASTRKLPEVYAQIESDLRSQYLLVYESSRPKEESGYRSLRVEVSRPGASVEARPGYYP